jgi:hypothetical protein
MARKKKFSTEGPNGETELAPVWEDDEMEEEQIAPPPSEPIVKKTLRYDEVFNHPQHGRCRVVTVPVNGECTIRVIANGMMLTHKI